jgi:hypothetical protein
MEIVAHGEFIGEALQNRGVSGLDVIEGHGVAATVVVDQPRSNEAVGIGFARIRGDDEGIQVA